MVYTVQYLMDTGITVETVEADSAKEALLLTYMRDNDISNSDPKMRAKISKEIQEYQNTYVLNDYGCQEIEEKTIDNM